MTKSMRYMYILPFWVIPHLRGIQAMKLISRKSETEEEACCESMSADYRQNTTKGKN